MANKKTSRISTTCQFVEKVYFYKNRANSLSLLERFVGFASLQSLWAFYLGILAETPNPFPVGRGYITGATAPRPCRGLRPCDPFLSTIEVFRQTDKPYFYDSQNLRSQKDKAMVLRLNRENENRSVPDFYSALWQ